MSDIRALALAIDWLPWVLGLPLAFGALAFLLGARPARAFAPPALLLTLLAAAALAGRVLVLGPQRHAVGGWGAPLGIELYADGLACTMLLMTAGVALFVGWYARHYFARADGGATYFWPLTGLLIGALNALYLSADVFNLYVALELLGLAAVGLVALAGGAAALGAALRYLLAALVGSLLYLLGVALLYGAHGTLALAELAARLTPGPTAATVIALMIVGLALKTALFPLHFWLPPAHGGAVTPVSALLSALVIKASFYLILRLWFGAFAPAVTVGAAQALGVLGAAAILWGSWLAAREPKLKMIVAYSTVAQVGYLFLVFPLATHAAGAEAAWNGAVYHAVAHALAKAAMFLAAGAMLRAVRAEALDSLDGISAQRPLALFAFALASVSLMGLPPSGGFIAKWLLLEAALAGGQWWWVAVMIAGGLLTAVYLFRVLRHAFLPARSGKQFRASAATLELSAFVLALAAATLGLAASGPLALAGIGAPFAPAGP